MSIIDYTGAPTVVADKDPDSVIDYKLLWGDYLGNDGVASSSWLTDDTSIVVDSSTHTSDETVVWVSGGAEGERCKVTNRITTNAGRTEDRTIIIPIKSL